LWRILQKADPLIRPHIHAAPVLARPIAAFVAQSTTNNAISQKEPFLASMTFMPKEDVVKIEKSSNSITSIKFLISSTLTSKII
jgi:hypothetical protein